MLPLGCTRLPSVTPRPWGDPPDTESLARARRATKADGVYLSAWGRIDAYNGVGFLANRGYDRDFAPVERQHPVEVRNDWIYDDEVRIDGPQGNEPTDLPPAQTLDCPLLRYEQSARREGTTVVIRRRAVLKPGSLPVSEHAALRACWNRASEILDAKLVFRATPAAPSPTVPSEPAQPSNTR
jgi:hypothetical protein